jgi:hypothetical protein
MRIPLRGTRSAGGLAVSLLGLAALAAPGSAGCSFLFVDGPPPQYQQMPYFQCTSSVGWPVVDTILGALSGASVLVALSRSDADYINTTYTRRDDIVGNALFLGLFGAAAIVGYTKTSDCREAQASTAMRRMPPQGYPPPYGYPPTAFPPMYAPPPQAPPAAAPPAPPPAPPPAAPSSSSSTDRGPARARLVPPLHLDLSAFAGRLGALPSGALLASARVRLGGRLSSID